MGAAPLAGRQKRKILIVERWGMYILEEYDRIKYPAIFYITMYFCTCIHYLHYDSKCPSLPISLFPEIFV